MIVGIDLGTTNSAVAVWRDGQAQLIPNSLGHLLTPSAVSIDEKGGLLVGLTARERQPTHPENTATAFKRLMGTKRALKLGKQSYAPEELSALVLASLKRDAEAFLGAAVTSVVITVPAYFNDKQRRATRRAGELAGLKVERLINEPTAAALAFGIHEHGLNEPFLVFDLGGGTFDISLVEMFDGVIEVRASAGDNRLGGEDFNEALVDFARKRLGAAFPSVDRSGRLAEVMRDAAERARRALSEIDEASIRFVWDGEEHTVAIDAETFAQLVEPLIVRLREPVLRSLRDSSTKVADLSEIVLVGGATRMPVVRKAVTRMFGRFPNTKVHPDHAVALGAAIQAGLKERNLDLQEVRLTDVCPFTLGVETTERESAGSFRKGLFSPIIERNTVIPASRTRSYYSLEDNQKAIVMRIFQGEARKVADNILLGEVRVDIPRRPAGGAGVDCRFTYDTSGLLEVDVTVRETEVAAQLVIFDEEDVALVNSLDARRAALAALKIHPRDQEANAAALARAERVYEGRVGNVRSYVGDLISNFENVLAAQEPRAIEAACQQLNALLDQIEGESFL